MSAFEMSLSWSIVSVIIVGIIVYCLLRDQEMAQVNEPTLLKDNIGFVTNLYFSILESWTSITAQRQVLNSLVLTSLVVLNTVVLPVVSKSMILAYVMIILGILISLIWILLLVQYVKISRFKEREAERLHHYISRHFNVDNIEAISQFYTRQSHALGRFPTLSWLEFALAAIFLFEFVFLFCLLCRNAIAVLS